MKSSLKKQVIFSIIAVILFFVSLEVATRTHHLFKYGFKSKTKEAVYIDQRQAKKIFEDFSKRKFESCPYVIYKTKPNQHYRTFNINSLGFRGKEIQKEKSKDTIRIVMLGGSALWGTGAPSDEGTISAKLEKNLSTFYKFKKFEVINAGDSGYVTAQEFITFYNRILDLNPDLVITFDGYNDVYTGFTNSIAGYPLNFPQFKEKLEQHNSSYYLYAAIKELLANSLFVEKLKNKIRIFMVKKTEETNADGIPKLYADTFEVARIYGRNLELLHILSKAHNIKTLFTLQPILAFGTKRLTENEKASLKALNLNVLGYSKYINKVYSLLIQELKRLEDEQEAKVLNLTDVFSDRQDTIFLDAAHFSEEANEIIAQRICAVVIKKDILR